MFHYDVLELGIFGRLALLSQWRLLQLGAFFLDYQLLDRPTVRIWR